MKKPEKIDINNAANGQLAMQFAEALRKVAANIKKYGDKADHEIAIKISIGKNIKNDFWQMSPLTAIKCNLKESLIGGATAILVEDGQILNGESQLELPLAKKEKE